MTKWERDRLLRHSVPIHSMKRIVSVLQIAEQEAASKEMDKAAEEAGKGRSAGSTSYYCAP